MARINLEETIWMDNRVFEAAEQARDLKKNLETHTEWKDYIMGAMVRAWRIAQDFWIDEDSPGSPIPLARWKTERLPQVLIDVGLAREVEGGIQMAGSEKNFEWRVKRIEAARKGGIEKAKKNKELIANSAKLCQTLPNSAESCQTLPNSAESCQSCPLPLPLPQDQNTNTNTNTSAQVSEIHFPAVAGPDLEKVDPASLPESTNEPAEAIKQRPVGPRTKKPRNASPRAQKAPSREPSPNSAVWEAYATAWAANWGRPPIRNAVTNAAVARLVSNLSGDVEKAAKLAAWYPAHAKRRWDIENCHSLTVLSNQLQTLLMYYETGHNPEDVASKITKRKFAK